MAVVGNVWIVVVLHDRLAVQELAVARHRIGG